MAGVLGMAFVPYYNHLIELLETNAELKKTARGIATQLCWAGGGTVVGGIVAGPPGAMVGGIVGSVVGYCRVDPYQSLVRTLKNLSKRERAELVAKVQELVGSTSIEALTRFIASQAQREVLLNLLRKLAEDFKGG
ncbi:hypothetical protein LOTGIDRAFT_155746 [Lottia gigantea]|uniref:Uncharacterized protein n=1 Tax=Lottia gigantea TaxID=225164 RepID=V4B2M2_LOTGI|nr:hypothetical protein LOTGIDRAFT_155746 [Lottia gigantea]ESO82729.1 hypothetical protein LOTGIDRAFT_155746 [Lottia gigantea]